MFWRDAIQYYPKGFDFEANTSVNLLSQMYSPGMFIEIFEELTKAAEIFEANPYQYVKLLKKEGRSEEGP